MLEIDNKNLCDLCFEEIVGNNCIHCDNIPNSNRYITALNEGTVLAGKYVVGRVLGKGGFGVTYLCYDLEKRRKVAIKEYFPESVVSRNTGDTSARIVSQDKTESFTLGAGKFYEEAQTVSKFRTCANIIHVIEFFYENQTAYFVMEYLEGVDLKKYIKISGGRLNPSIAISMILKVVDALAVIHKEGVLHRDISPDNIFVCNDGTVKLIDFGAARFVLGEASKSLSVILKQGFAPLEQYNKKGVQGPFTDIYALGATLYFALTGRVMDDVMSRIEDDTLDMTGVPESLQPILSKMLAVKSQNRYQNTEELKADLLRFDVSTDVPSPPKTAVHIQPEHVGGAVNPPAVAPKKKSFALPIILVSVLMVVVASVLLVLYFNKSYERDSISKNTYVPVKSLKIVTNNLSLEIGEVRKLAVSLEPSNATNQSLVWSSSDHSVASVDSNGVVTAKGVGKARITVRALGFSSSCDVTVSGHYIPTPPTTNPSTDEPIVTERQPIKAKVGDYIKFGKYEQDNDFYNGSEEIEWKVLAIKDGRALIISKYGLEAKAYDDGTTAVTWENCKLREWLNLDFYNLAFDEEEKTRIPVVTVTDYENPEHGTDPGNSTNDKVFLLSINEAKKYFSSDDDRQCKPTVYAEAQGVWIPGEDDEHPDKCWWWLRSPGDRPRGDEIGLAATVNRGGWINYYGNGVEKVIIAVRPAIWIELN